MRLSAAAKKRSADWVLQFVNIVFLLLLYFLISGTISRHPEPGLILPAAPVSNGLSAGVFIEISQTGEVSLDGKPTRQLATALDSYPRNSLLTISADKRLKAVALVATLKQLRTLGFERIAILSATNTP